MMFQHSNSATANLYGLDIRVCAIAYKNSSIEKLCTERVSIDIVTRSYIF